MTTVSNMVENTKKSAISTKSAEAQRERRRAAIPILRLHHNAIRTDDMEATRIFYEDLLGMPLVHTMKMGSDPTTGKPTPYLHCFFEMADGSAIAFFQFLGRGRAPGTPQDVFDHHFAVKVASFAQLQEIKKRFDDNKYASCGINHGFCYSLYVRDPNNMAIEIVADPDDELEMNEKFVGEAREDWLSWSRGDYASNEHKNPPHTYPLPTSSVDEMNKVLPAERIG